MAYIAFNNGLSIRSVAPGTVPEEGEAYFDEWPEHEQLLEAVPGYEAAHTAMANTAHNDFVKQQILDLEVKQHRAIREFILGSGDKTKVEEIDSRIAELRAQLK